ncbi:MAG: DDE transposase family protein, partial [Phormidesmis sp. CAN_BIN44]|nr:DDE transposase family protein [Phormidesmis sp. CAN_BIN44]
ASTQREQWGPFESQGVAIARRVGLIRAGKCKPV